MAKAPGSGGGSFRRGFSRGPSLPVESLVPIVKAGFAKQKDSLAVFRSGNARQIESMHQLLEPIGKSINEFQFQNNDLLKYPRWPGHLCDRLRHEIRFDPDIAVEGDSNRIIAGADPCFAQVAVVDLGPCVELVEQETEPLQSGQMPGFPGKDLFRPRQMTGE